MKFKISELVDFNSESIRKNDKLDEIHYLDTANLTEGVFEEIKKYNWKEDKVPSRARRRVKENDILVSTVRPNQKHYGFITAKEQEYIVSTGFTVITPITDKVDPYYLYQYLTLEKTTNYLQMIAENSTSAYPSIKPKDIGNLEIELPDLNKQKQIGNFLWDINKKVHLNSSIISNLEELAQTLFKRWFVDFEFPNEEGKPYKSSGGKMVESELGMIPEGWLVDNFEKIITIGSGKRPKSKVDIQDKNNQIPIIGASKVMGYTETELFDESIIVIGRVGTHGVVQRLNVPCWPTDNTFVLRSKYEEFMYHKLKTIDYKSMNRGSTQPLLTQKDIKNVKVILPSNDLLIEFEDTQKKFSSKISQLKEENTKLKNLRDTLLPKLLSGEIELPDDMEVMDDVPIS